MLAGGGSPFILLPVVSLLLGAQAVAPVITTGLLIGNAQRGLFFGLILIGGLRDGTFLARWLEPPWAAMASPISMPRGYSSF